jgi:hypothetical protein
MQIGGTKMKGLRKGQAYLIYFSGYETQKRIGIYQGVSNSCIDEFRMQLIAVSPDGNTSGLLGNTYTYSHKEIIRHIPKHMILIEKFKMEEGV